MILHVTCEVCSKPITREDTGRPRIYCSDRCKAKAKRRRERDANRTARENVRALRVDEGEVSGLCHVCGQEPATRGSPEPLVCEACARRATG